MSFSKNIHIKKFVQDDGTEKHTRYSFKVIKNLIADKVLIASKQIVFPRPSLDLKITLFEFENIQKYDIQRTVKGKIEQISRYPAIELDAFIESNKLNTYYTLPSNYLENTSWNINQISIHTDSMNSELMRSLQKNSTFLDISVRSYDVPTLFYDNLRFFSNSGKIDPHHLTHLLEKSPKLEYLRTGLHFSHLSIITNYLKKMPKSFKNLDIDIYKLCEDNMTDDQFLHECGVRLEGLKNHCQLKMDNGDLLVGCYYPVTVCSISYICSKNLPNKLKTHY